MHPIVPLLQLLHLLKRVEGRKKLQKLVHILQECGVPFPERFEYSYYGMYSAQLRSEVERLESEKLVNESPCAAGTNLSYSVETTDDLGKLMKEIGLEEEPAWAATAKHLNGLTAQELEGISTILFLKECGLAGEELKKRLLALKPHLEAIYAKCEKEAGKLPDYRPAAAAA